MNDPRPAVLLTPADIDATIRTFTQRFGRAPTTEELACLEYARKLLSEKLTTVANDGDKTGFDEVVSASDFEEASRTTEASG